jgi:hypothetical protein
MVLIDSTTLFTKQTELGPHCSAVGIGCMSSAEGVITDMDVTTDLHAGVNTITFYDYQEVGDTPFGVDFAGSISYETGGDPPPNGPPNNPPNDPPPPVPETVSIVLLLSAALPAGYLIRRKAAYHR